MDTGPWTAICLGIIGLFGSIIAALLTRKRDSMDNEMTPEIEQKLEGKLDEIQADVTDLQIRVGTLKGDQARTAQDVTGMRNEVGELRREITALREWLTNHVFKGRERDGT